MRRGKGKTVGLLKLLVASKTRFGVVLCVCVHEYLYLYVYKCIKIGIVVKSEKNITKNQE